MLGNQKQSLSLKTAFQPKKFTAASMRAAHSIWNTPNGWDNLEQLAKQIDREAGIPNLLQALKDLLFACDSNQFVDADEEMKARLKAENAAAQAILKAEVL